MTIDLSDVVGITLNGSSVVKIEDTLSNILWEKNNNAEEYFYIENLTSSANTLSIKKNNASAPTINVYRSTNKTTWTSIGSTSTTAITYSIPANSKVYLKATATSWAKKVSYSTYANMMSCSSSFAVGGNIMSLIKGDSFSSDSSFTAEYALYNLFYGSTNLMNIDKLVLPSKLLQNYCYYNMFNGCTGLTVTPELPATTLVQGCYKSMFNGCTKLSTIKCLATDISATGALTDWTNGVASKGTFCKAYAKTWPTGTSGIPTNWTTCDIRDNNILALAFQTAGTIKIAKVSSSTDFQPNISMSINSTSSWQTFGSGRSFDTTYNISKGQVVYFKGNNPDGLNKSNTDYLQFAITGTVAAFGSIMSLIDDGVGTTTTIPNERCFAELFRNTTITRAPELPATTLTRYCYLNMFRNCPALTVAPNLPAETLAPNCYQSMFNGCTKLVSVNLPAETLASACYNQTFVGCTSLTNISLPAATLVDSCYNIMFQNCSALNRIICNATDISAPNAVNNWTDGVASSGTFCKAPGVTWPAGTSGIPSSWTVVEI